MGYNRYRRRCSLAGGALADTAYIANRLPWQWAAVFGVLLFGFFYWILPAWMLGQIDSMQSTALRPVMDAIIAKRVHWSQWLAIALALVCAFFAVRNYYAIDRLGRHGRSNVSLLSRLLARLLD